MCTGNSARSQIAEAVLNRKGRGRFRAESAGSSPAARVNPLAIQALRERHRVGGPFASRSDRLGPRRWDFVITVCDRAREACPVFPGQPILAHWGMPDPAAGEGDEADQRAAFVDALTLISRRVDLLLALPVEKLDRLVLEAQVKAIGEVSTASTARESRA